MACKRRVNWEKSQHDGIEILHDLADRRRSHREECDFVERVEGHTAFVPCELQANIVQSDRHAQIIFCNEGHVY